MSKIIFELANGQDGEILLIDNAYVEYWKHVFIENMNKCNKHSLSNTLPYEEIAGHQLIYREPEHQVTDEQLFSYVEIINESIHVLESNGLSFKHKAYRGMDQKQCNLLHRQFTTGIVTRGTCTNIHLTHEDKVEIKKEQYDMNSQNDILLTFSDHNSMADVFLFNNVLCHELEIINAYIHHYEKSFYSKRARHLSEQYGISFEWQIKKEDGITDEVNTSHILSNDLMQYGNSDPKYNVYDLKCIGGKDYYTAWVNYDDPSEWDIVNNNCTTKGGFEIAPWTSKLIRETIRPWVETYNIPSDDRFISPIPIGKLLSNVDIKYNKIHKAELV